MDRSDWDAVAIRGKHYLPDILFLRSKRRQIIGLIKRWDTDPGNKRLLKTDIFEEALGGDGILSFLTNRYGKIFCLDVSSKMIEGARKKNSQCLAEYVLSDVRSPAFKDNTFDLIISNSTIDHFPQIDTALQELYRILRPKGVLILTLHNRLQFAFSFTIFLKRLLRIKDYSYGYSYYYKSIYPRLLEAGFQVSSLDYIYFFPPFLTYLISKCKGRPRKTLKRIFRIYEKVTSTNKYLSKFAGSNIAIRLVK
jgi:SAM-dependent methyltransferase